jgi:hypothetical protein
VPASRGRGAPRAVGGDETRFHNFTGRTRHFPGPRFALVARLSPQRVRNLLLARNATLADGGPFPVCIGKRCSPPSPSIGRARLVVSQEVCSGSRCWIHEQAATSAAGPGVVDCCSEAVADGSSSDDQVAAWATLQKPTRPGHGKLLELGSTGSKKAIGASQIDPLPRQVCATEARVHSRAFPGIARCAWAPEPRTLRAPGQVWDRQAASGVTSPYGSVVRPE